MYGREATKTLENMMQYYQAIISSETTQQGLRILDQLLTKQLAFGGPVFNGPSKFLWNFKGSAVPGGMQKDELLIDEHDYCFAITYTREDLNQRRHVDAVAALTFVPANEIATRTRKSS